MAKFKVGDLVLVTCDTWDKRAHSLGEFEVGQVIRLERDKLGSWVHVRLYLSHVPGPIYLFPQQCRKIGRAKDESRSD